MFTELFNKLFEWSGLSPTTEPRPLLISISLCIAIFLSLRICLFLLKSQSNLTYFKLIVIKYTQLFFFIISIVLLLNYIGLVFTYLLNSNFASHTEPTIAAVSWLFQRGHPIYHELNSAERYSLIYGPMLYLINGLFLKLFEPSIFTSKLASALALLVALVLIFLILIKKCSLPTTTIYCTYTTLALFSFGNIIYSVRADSLILMFVSLGLLGTFITNPLISTCLCAFSLGITINLKLSAILYFLPVFILFYQRHGGYYTFASTLGSGLIGYAPFLIPGISIKNYVAWFQQISKHGFSIDQFKENLEWAFFLLVPVLTGFGYMLYTNKQKFRKFAFDYKFYLTSLIISTFTVIFIASKPGSGVHHLIPFIPLYVHLFSLIIVETQDILKLPYENRTVLQLIISVFLALYLAALQTGLVKEILNVDYLNSIPGADILEDINNVKNTYKNQTIEMGYGTNDDYYFTFYRPVLVFDGNPYLVDANALMDMQKADLKLPTKTLESLKSCQTKIWLIPKNKPPFEQPNYYPPNRDIFSNKFKKIFLNRYKKTTSSKYYDLWFCKDKS